MQPRAPSRQTQSQNAHPSSTHSHSQPSSIRRNLFNQTLSRRPTSRNTSSAPSSHETDHENQGNQQSNSRSSSISAVAYSQNSEIVRRDRNGDYDVGDPSLALRGLNAAGQGDGEGLEEDGMGDAVGGEFGARERQRLTEAVRMHRLEWTREPAEPAQLLADIKANMKSTMLAMADDNWMYEVEEEIPIRS